MDDDDNTTRELLDNVFDSVYSTIDSILTDDEKALFTVCKKVSKDKPDVAILIIVALMAYRDKMFGKLAVNAMNTILELIS